MRFRKLKIDRFILGGTSYNPKPSLKDYMKLNLINYPKYFRARFVKIFIPFSIVFSGTKNFELCKGYFHLLLLLAKQNCLLFLLNILQNLPKS